MNKLSKKSGRVAGRLAKKINQSTSRAVEHVKDVFVGRLDNAHKVRGKIIAWVMIMVALIFCAGLQYMWYRSTHTTMAFVSGGGFAEATLGRVDNLNPLFVSTNSEQVIARLVFSGLYKHDTSGSVRADLARGMSVSEDELVYDVTLRSGVKWHDGVALSAEDVVYTVEVMRDPRSRTILHAKWQDVEVEKLDEYTVRFRLPSPYAAFYEMLTFAVLPSHILGGVSNEQLREDSFGMNPIGTGPFEFRTMRASGGGSGRIVYLVANERYHKGRPKLDRFSVHAFETREEILHAMNTARVNATAELTAADEAELRMDRINVREAMVNSGVFAFLNTRSDALQDTRVRRAVRHSIDMSEVREELKGAAPLDLPILASQVRFELPDFRDQFNRERAAELMSEAGFLVREGRLVNEEGEQLRLRIATIASDNFVKVANSMAAQLVAAGFAVEVNVGELGGGMGGQNFLQNVLMVRDYDILIYEIEMGPDPDVFPFYHSSQRGTGGLNLSEFSNIVVDDLLVSARATLDNEVRRVKYEAFLNRWISDVPAIGVFQTKAVYYYNRNARVFSEDSRLVTSMDRFADVIYWATVRGRVHRTP